MEKSALCLLLKSGIMFIWGPIVSSVMTEVLILRLKEIIGRRAVIKDCSILLPDSVLPPDSVVPPFTIFGGAPARPVGKVAESHQDHMVELTTQLYQKTKLVE